VSDSSTTMRRAVGLGGGARRYLSRYSCRSHGAPSWSYRRRGGA
jgi:hypothetical protein